MKPACKKHMAFCFDQHLQEECVPAGGSSPEAERQSQKFDVTILTVSEVGTMSE